MLSSDVDLQSRKGKPAHGGEGLQGAQEAAMGSIHPTLGGFRLGERHPVVSKQQVPCDRKSENAASDDDDPAVAVAAAIRTAYPHGEYLGEWRLATIGLRQLNSRRNERGEQKL